MSRRGWILFLTVGLVWGLPYLLIKEAVAGFSPITVVFIRTAIAAVLLVPLTLWRGELMPVLRRWPTLLAFTAIEIALPWVLLSDAETHLSSSLSGLLVAALPVVAAVLVLVAGGDERLGPRRWLGIFVGFVGVAVLVGFDVGRSDLWAAGEIGLVTICYAVGPQIVSRSMGDLSGTGVVAAAFAVVYAGPAAVQLAQASPRAPAIAAVVVLGVVCTAFAFPVFFALIRESGPVRATVVAYLNPAVAVLAGVVVLGESFGASTAVGFALVIAGSVFSTRRSALEVDADVALAAAGEVEGRPSSVVAARAEQVAR